jgi:outer membrane lipoprotein-sorting protein
VQRIFGFLILPIAVIVTACSTVLPAPLPTKAVVAPTLPLAPTAQPFPTIQPSPTVAPSPTVPLPTPTLANPLDAIKGAFRGFGGAKSFRAKMTSTSGAAANQEMILEVVMPNRFHMTSNQFEAYMIASTFFMKVGNQWQKIAMPKAFDLSMVDAKKLEADLGASTETKLIGAELLDGTPTTVYQYTTTIKTPTPTTNTSKVWIGVADGLPRKMESMPKTGGKTVITYYDYNVNIVIEPPIK